MVGYVCVFVMPKYTHNIIPPPHPLHPPTPTPHPHPLHTIQLQAELAVNAPAPLRPLWNARSTSAMPTRPALWTTYSARCECIGVCALVCVYWCVCIGVCVCLHICICCLLFYAHVGNPKTAFNAALVSLHVFPPHTPNIATPPLVHTQPRSTCCQRPSITLPGQ